MPDPKDRPGRGEVAEADRVRLTKDARLRLGDLAYAYNGGPGQSRRQAREEMTAAIDRLAIAAFAEGRASTAADGERERCARIAERYAGEAAAHVNEAQRYGAPIAEQVAAGGGDYALRIAAAIRALPPETTAHHRTQDQSDRAKDGGAS